MLEEEHVLGRQLVECGEAALRQCLRGAHSAERLLRLEHDVERQREGAGILRAHELREVTELGHRSDLHALAAEHLERRIRDHHVIEVEAVHRPPVHMRGGHREGDAADEAPPLGDRVVQRKVREGLGDRVRRGLVCRGDREQQPHLVADLMSQRFELAHHAVAPIDAHVNVVVVRPDATREHLIDAGCELLLHARQPRVELPNDEGLAHAADDDGLVAGQLGTFELDRHAFCPAEA